MDGVSYIFGTLICLPSTARAVFFKTEFLNLFLHPSKLAKRHISTNQPYFIFLRKFFIFRFLRFFKKTTGMAKGSFLTFWDKYFKGFWESDVRINDVIRLSTVVRNQPI